MFFMDVGQFCINKLFGRSKEAENLFTPEKFHKSRKIEDMWVAPFLASNKKAGNFNVEDYFPEGCLRDLFLVLSL